MAGFASITGQPDYVYSDNASFDGTERGGGLVSNGQLWIGNTSTGRPTVSTLIDGTGVSITNGSGTIQISTTGAVVPDVALGTVLQGAGIGVDPTFSAAFTAGSVVFSNGTNWLIG